MKNIEYRADGVYVVDTEREVYLGQLLWTEDTVTVHSGLPGRPAVVSIEDIDEITDARYHSDVVFA
jgi:hypothetical protein